MEWLTSLGPLLTSVFGATSALGGAWMVHRATNRKTQVDERKAQVEEKASEAATFVQSVQTVTTGFTQLLEQQRETNARTLERVTTLENRVERLEEEQRMWRRWKVAAVDYIHQLRALLDKLHGIPPVPPQEIADDLGEPAAH
ncbi:hypothetical protein EV284_6506 [Streptomyces sp. BK022]|uniref:hypothetical protein n=1 Tax=Streptomyces sp. BK022 TaxID=2512123 RepID=UPI001029A55C|nr:hypothetical protein [Streptomyces sp. BK022]RZU28340.1 hypothetical protein EV284_6506 [Streptomyces sp. BK022]